MAHQQVPAGNGVQWLTDAVQLILKNPAPFLLMGLVVGVIGLVPLLGALALMVLGPALYGGIAFAAREQQAGRSADFQHLFQAFRENGKIGPMVMLCLPGVVAGVTIVVLGAIFVGSAIAGLGAAHGNQAAPLAGMLGAGGVLFLLLALAVGLASFALTFFAIPRVMLDSVDAVAAMKDSLQACLRNVGAVLVYLVVLCFVVVVLGIVLAWIPLLGQLALMTALVPVASIAAFVAWRQVYRHDITQELPPASPPPPPGVEV